jgi:hypothetical protein
MVEIAKKLIRAGHMYADNTDVDTMREERLKCIESKARNMPAAEAERLFEEMLKGSEVRCNCLRAVGLGTLTAICSMLATVVLVVRCAELKHASAVVRAAECAPPRRGACLRCSRAVRCGFDAELFYALHTSDRLVCSFGYSLLFPSGH